MKAEDMSTEEFLMELEKRISEGITSADPIIRKNPNLTPEKAAARMCAQVLYVDGDPQKGFNAREVDNRKYVG